MTAGALQGFVIDGIDLQLIEKDAHDIVCGIPEFSGPDPAKGTVIHPNGHGGTQTVVQDVEQGILHFCGKGGECVLVRHIGGQDGGKRIGKTGLIHQRRSKSAAKGFADMPGLNHLHSSDVY